MKRIIALIVSAIFLASYAYADDVNRCLAANGGTLGGSAVAAHRDDDFTAAAASYGPSNSAYSWESYITFPATKINKLMFRATGSGTASNGNGYCYIQVQIGGTWYTELTQNDHLDSGYAVYDTRDTYADDTMNAGEGSSGQSWNAVTGIKVISVHAPTGGAYHTSSQMELQAWGPEWTNYIRDASTTHTQTGNKPDTYSNAYDGDLATYWAVYYWERGADGNKNEYNYLVNHFPSPKDIKMLAWKITAHAQSWSGASANEAGAGVWVQVSYDNGSNWTDVLAEAGSGGGDWSWNYAQNGVYVTDTNSGAGWADVTDVRVMTWNKVYRKDEGAGGGNEESYVYTYEIEAWGEQSNRKVNVIVANGE